VGLSGLGQGLVAGSREMDTEALVPIKKTGNVLTVSWLITVSLLNLF
jgi:hypothetical protein